MYPFQKKFCELNYQDKVFISRLFPLTGRSHNQDVKLDVLIPQTSIKSNENLKKFSVSRKLFDSNCENTTKERTIVDISHNQQEASGETIGTTVTALDKQKCIINEKNQDINKVHDDKEANEKLQTEDCVTSDITLVTSTDHIRDDKRQNDYIEVDDTVVSQSAILFSDTPSEEIDTSVEKSEVSNGHVLGLPLPVFTNDTVIDRNKPLKFVSDHKVTLKGLPGSIIDLTHDIKPSKKDVDALLDRFFNKHVGTNKQTNDKSEVTVIHLQNTQNGPVPVKKTFPYKLSTNIDNLELNKPGAKLKRLKEDLERQMTLRRNEQWKQKMLEQEAEEKEEEEWDEEEGSNYHLNKQEKACNLELSNSEESEPEENDICLKDKTRRKYLFADDEAEVTDDEGLNMSTEGTDDESDADQMEHNKQATNIRCRKRHMNNASEEETDQEEEHEDLDADVEDKSESDSQDADNINVCTNIKNKKNRFTKQLMREFQDISDVDSIYLENKTNQMKNIKTDIDVSKKLSENNDSVSENECSIPVCKQNTEDYTNSQICKTPLVKTSMLDFVSPITQLSVLNTSQDLNKKDLLENEYLVGKHIETFMECTQNDEPFERIGNIRNKNISKKRLFDDIGETIDDEYLMKLCSGKFKSTQSSNLDLKDLSSQSNVTESQLSELDSGNLNTRSHAADAEQLRSPDTNNKISQNLILTLTGDSNKSVNYAEKEKVIGVVNPTVASSDDDDQSNDADTFFKPKRCLMKKLILSDSEEENEEDAQSYDNENDNTDNESVELSVDYDSEENEIIVPEKNIKRVAADFLEEEAELSESDWDSADEDEKDLDKLEFEEGDNEHIDEHKIKDELGKIHVKEMLDEDKREVRLLKELLFEDGDLHTDGPGRERKFRWRNIGTKNVYIHFFSIEWFLQFSFM